MARTWAGIGSRQLQDGEGAQLARLARDLRKQGWWLHSGNADGADAAFQSGANGQGTAFLPWPGHNPGNLHCMEVFSEIPPEAIETARRLHPKGRHLHGKALLYMARNVLIVTGNGRQVDFLTCCADPVPQGVAGGSQLAWRLAQELGIPCFNLRTSNGWEELERRIGVPPPHV